MTQVALASGTDFEGFRAAARGLLARGVDPACVTWMVGDVQPLLPEEEEPLQVGCVASTASAPGLQPDFVRVPASFVEACSLAAMHREPQRYALMYRLLWRLQREPTLRDDPLDADMLQLRRLAKAVGRDMHKMRAFVRFREVRDADGSEPVHVAWFEPDHLIVEANAPWFSRRFANIRWAILTPDRCADWDGSELRFTPGASRAAAPAADAGEALWLTYYRSIFNPARLKLAMMTKEMPRRYWRNLPEAQLISPLSAAYAQRSARMIEQGPTVPLRRVPPFVKREGPLEGLPALQAGANRCQLCPLGAIATQAVPGEGPLRAHRMFVGEQPGDEEDLKGRPFVGPAGRLLDRALREAGIDRSAIYVTNAVRHFKYELRGKRRIHKTPSQREATACSRWLEEEIALVQAGALVALGATAARSLLGRAVAVTSERGRWHARADGARVFVTLHPSALLRMPRAEFAAAYAAFVDDMRAACAA